ncbi:antibiotic biosynthesis monooxygenase family protein [Ammonicoccus fulvus]|uniref:Antibiotic biosynthesis monooxygenase family protein n=1 Tax=Ammonicoccus fulvus TaxID=3138240 RepID=A0ABZ3FV58_9ACTN
MSETFIVSNRIEVEADRAEAFEAVFIESTRTTLEGVPGLHRVTLQKPAKPGMPYISTMEFDNAQSFQGWLKSDSFKRAHGDDQAEGMQAPSASNCTP